MSSSDTLSEQHAELEALRASEVELTEGPDAAIAVLGPLTDPIRVKAAIGILIRANRQQQAADLVRDRVPDERWIALATFVSASLGDLARASHLVNLADDSTNPLIMRETRLAFAQGVVNRWQDRWAEGLLLVKRQWPSEDVQLARTVIDTLDPMLSLVRANRRIQGDLELAAVGCAIYCANILNDEQLLNPCIEWLIRHIPVPMLTAEICLRGLIPCPANLPNRLRTEHPNDFQAAFLAAMLERDVLNRAEDSFDALLHLAADAATDEQRTSLAISIVETCGRCPFQRVNEAIPIVTSLHTSDGRLIAFLNTFQLVGVGRFAEARQEMENVRDESDATWWQVFAQVAELTGDDQEAESAWQRACDLMPHPDVLRRSVRASLDRRRFQLAVRNLKKILADDPDSQQDLRAIAWALVKLGDYAQASQYLQRLVVVDPATVQHRIALAQCLCRSARIPEAIAALKPVCEGDDPPIDAILLQSELLKADGKAAESLRLLETIAADHWDEPRFLLGYMNHAYAAGNDRLGHEVFARLVELRREGKVPAELMQEQTLEQLLELGDHYRSRREALQDAVLAGRVPWLLAEDIFGNPAVWAWTIHTQTLPWVSEDRLTRASYTVYATNGFTPRSTSEVRQLEPIVGSPRQEPVVVDLTALLTLHKLERLAAAADFFGKLILPATYGNLAVRDADRFGQHQPSREGELIRIRSEIEGTQIHIAHENPAKLPLVDEYADTSTDCPYRLQDLVDPICKSQKASQTMIDELRAVATRPGVAAEGKPKLTIGMDLIFDLDTLRMLTSLSVFPCVLSVFNVHIMDFRVRALTNELRAMEIARRAKESHDALWRAVAELSEQGKLEWMCLPQEPTSDQDQVNTENGHPLHLDALRLARHTGNCLLSDDRVLQVMMYQIDSGSICRAFSCSHLAAAMLSVNALSADEVATDFRRLMSWRYRFVVPPPRILLAWAMESVDNPPGDALLDVAVYLHDCFRDPGLHCGFEQTAPPMPMAGKLVTAWIDAILSFLAGIWNEPSIPDDAASRLTRWIGEELIPSCPQGFEFRPIGQNVTRVERVSTLQMAMVKFITLTESRRANLGLRVLSESLGLDEDAFLTATVEAINAIKRRAS